VHGFVHAAADPLVGQVPEPAFYLVDLRGAGWREMQAEPGWRASQAWTTGALYVARLKLADYGSAWITERPGLRPRTMDLYRWLLRKHIEPYLGGVPVGKLSTRQVREWRATLLANGVSVSVTAKAYRLLRAILTTAVDDDKLLPPPVPDPRCRNRGRSRTALREHLAVFTEDEPAALVFPGAKGGPLRPGQLQQDVRRGSEAPAAALSE
jgi:hypothetical protein